MACVLSGFVMRRPVSPQRAMKVIFRLVIPFFIWVLFLKPYLKDLVMVKEPLTPERFWAATAKAITLQGKPESEWYLFALIIWRCLAFIFFPLISPPAIFVTVVIIGAASGYFVLSAAGAAFMNFNPAFGFLIMFGLGLLTPIDKLTEMIPAGTGSSRCIRAVWTTLGVLFTFLLWPALFAFTNGDSTKPEAIFGHEDFHKSYAESSTYADLLKGNGACTGDARLFWVRRVTTAFAAYVQVLAFLLFVCPRGNVYILSKAGTRTLYPYLLHEFFLYARAAIVTAAAPVGQPLAPVVQILLLACHALGAFLLTLALASTPIKTLFQLCLEPACIVKVCSNRDNRGGGGGAGGAHSGGGDTAKDPLLGANSAAKEEYWPRFGNQAVQAGKKDEAVQAAPVTDDEEGPVRKNRGCCSCLADLTEEPDGGRPIPWQTKGHKYYKILLWASLLMGLVPLILLNEVIFRIPDFANVLKYATGIFTANPLFIVIWGVGVLVAPLRPFLLAAYHCRELWKGLQPVPVKDNRGTKLQHYVMIAEYKEPEDVLAMTIESLVAQSIPTRERLSIIIASEAKDTSSVARFESLKKRFGHHFVEMFQTLHKLTDGEVAGKSSNENHAIRTLFKKVEARGQNPYTVMVNICDADSVFAERYLEQVEYSFHCQRSPEMLLYSGPLNITRNWFDADPLVRQYEMLRQDAELKKFEQAEHFTTQSNYSITLGLARDIGFWDPTNTPEDFHTSFKIFITTNASMTVAPVYSVIINDLVPGLKDRYVQAKRHCWGVTEGAWIMASYHYMPFRVWLQVAFFAFTDQVLSIWNHPVFFVMFPGFWYLISQITIEVVLFLGLSAAIPYLMNQWLRVWMVDFFLWRYIMPDNPAFPKTTTCQWLQLWTQWAFIPLIEPLSLLAFHVIPTFDALIHAYRSTNLAYVTAPKGDMVSKGSFDGLLDLYSSKSEEDLAATKTEEGGAATGGGAAAGGEKKEGEPESKNAQQPDQGWFIEAGGDGQA